MSQTVGNSNTLKTVTVVVTGSVLLACLAKLFANSNKAKSTEPQSTHPSVVKSLADVSAHDAGFAIGLNWIDLDRNGPVFINAYNQADLKEQVAVNPRTSTSSTGYSAGSPWLSICKYDRDLQFGMFSTEGKPGPWSPQITFDRPYASPPKVVVWFKEFDFDNAHNWRLQASAENVTATGFTLKLSTWGDSKLNKAAVTWIAHASNRSNIMSGTFDTREFRPWHQPKPDNKKDVKFDHPFGQPPRVFIGLNLFDMDCHSNLRLKSYTQDVTEQGMAVHLDSWLNTTHYASRADWIAIQDL